MTTARQIKENLYYIGASDRRLALFENIMPVPRGVSYNAYLLLDEQTALLDTVDNAVGEQFIENLETTLNGRALNYLVIHHVEPDHLSMTAAVLQRHPEARIVCSAQAAKFIGQFFDIQLHTAPLIVKEGDTLTTGRHTFTFVAAPMVHWPEVLVSYESSEKILFSADAFGTFGALGGNLFADEVNFDRDWLDDARRYYTNIVGKYGPNVEKVLQKAAALDIRMVCPLHGPVWRENIGYYIEKHQRWCTYTPESESVAIFYGSPYGHTASAATALANMLAEAGIADIRMYDVSATHVSYLVAEAFRCRHIVLAAPTYNNGLFPPMETLLLDLQAHQLQNRTFALIENGTWSPKSAQSMRKILETLTNCPVLEPVVTLKSSLKKEQMSDLKALAEHIFTSYTSYNRK